MIKGSIIAILGPNGVGKTSVAFELARRINSEVINLDKVYIYKHFPNEFLEPDKNIIPANVYAEMVREKCKEVLAKGRIPIIEGGSTTYAPAFLNSNKKNKFCQYIIGLYPPNNLDRKVKFKKRIEEALKEGLLNEIKNGLKNYGNSLIMQDAHFVIPMARYLRGETNLKEAKEEVVIRCLKYADEQLKMFQKYPEIVWLKHKPRDKIHTVERIISILK